MSRYMPDGGVIPSGVSSSTKRVDEHMTLFGVFRGIVIKTIYPDDPKNTNGARMEYVVKVRGQEYPNAVSLKSLGGVFNYDETILKDVEKSYSGKIAAGTYDENVDGNVVYVMFLEGNGNVPIIIGSAEHTKRPKYKPIKKLDGRFSIEEFNGIEFLVDKDSNYSIKQVGKKDIEGKILNQPAVGSQIKMFGIGDIEFNTHGTVGSADLRMRMIKASKRIEIYAQEDQIILDAVGILVKDKHLNSVTMDTNGTIVLDKNLNKITMSPTGIEALDKNGNKVTQDAAGTIILDKNGNKITMGAAGIEVLDKNGNKITLDSSGININSSANLTKIDGSIYGAHQHIGNLGVPTPPPLDANTE